MYFTTQKADRYINDLKKYIFEEVRKIESLKHAPYDVEGAHAADFDDSGWEDFAVGSLWGGKDQTHWFRCKVEIPKEWKDDKVALFFTPSAGQFGGLSGSETLVYIDGAPTQGLDVNHHEIHVLPEWKERGTVQVALKAFSGLQDVERRFAAASLVKINIAAEDFYFRALAIQETVKVLPEGDFDRENLIVFLNEALNAVDFRKPGSPGFYQSIAQANQALQESLSAYQSKSGHRPVITAVGHSHIDVAWLWQLKHTREKSARTFSTVNHLMKQYPEYQFIQSQPQLYDYIREDCPAIYEEIKENVKAGKWEVTGGMWVESDCNVPSGESLVRQLLFGTRFIRKEFGVECRVLWLPDVFGYSWALPQILAKSGLKYFMTTKISWSQYNRPAYDTFMWRGLDGTEILTHFITTTESEKPRYYTYNGMLNPASAQRSWEHYQQKEINDELLLAYGWGDGGGGPTKEMIEMGRRMKELPGIPKIEFGKVEPYFERLAARVKGQKRLPTVDGELYLEYHRGTYTSQGKIKRDNRKSEVLLHDVEFLHSLAQAKLEDHLYPQGEINENWKILLRNQFHDILPGSSITEVYEDAAEEFAKLFASAEHQEQDALQLLADAVDLEGEKLVVFNSLSWDRGGTVTLPWQAGLEGRGIWTEDGDRLLCSIVEYGGKKQLEIKVPEIPALGYRTFALRPEDGSEASPQAGVTVSGRVIESKYYRITFNEQGQIASLYDKEAEREVVPAGCLANELQAFEDRPMNFDCWDIDLYYQEKQYPVDELTRWEVLEDGPERAVLALEWKYLDSTIRQRIFVYSDRRGIDFATEVDWHEHSILLKAAFPVAVRNTKATYEIQFGNVERPTHYNTSWDWAKFETVAHKWVDLSERDYGVSLLNDCKYGHDIKDNVIRLTLLTSGIDPDPAADQGHHEFTYSLLPHRGDWYEGGTVQAAYELNYPLRGILSSRVSGSLDSAGQLLKVEGQSTILDTVKKAEDGDELVLRFYEFANRRDQVTVTFPHRLQAVRECSLMEQDDQEVDFASDRFTFTLNPYEIRTFKIRQFQP